MRSYRIGAKVLATTLAAIASAGGLGVVVPQAAWAQTVAPVPVVPPPSNTTRALTDAPVPDRSVPDIAPADRAGTRTSQDAGPLNSTPFSGLPSSRLGGGTVSPADRDTGQGQNVLPNVSK